MITDVFREKKTSLLSNHNSQKMFLPSVNMSTSAVSEQDEGQNLSFNQIVLIEKSKNLI